MRQYERARRGLSADLLDCLQLWDKMHILMRNQAFLKAADFGSTSPAKKASKDLGALSNNLAHGQDVTRYDWPQIVRLARRTKEMYWNRWTVRQMTATRGLPGSYFQTWSARLDQY